MHLGIEHGLKRGRRRSRLAELQGVGVPEVGVQADPGNRAATSSTNPHPGAPMRQGRGQGRRSDAAVVEGGEELQAADAGGLDAGGAQAHSPGQLAQGVQG